MILLFPEMKGCNCLRSCQSIIHRHDKQELEAVPEGEAQGLFGWQNDLSNIRPKFCEVLGTPLSQSAFCFLPQRWTRNSSSKSKRSQPGPFVPASRSRLRPGGSELARFYLPLGPPLGPGRGDHPSPTRLPPSSPPRPVGRQVGPHLRAACPSPALPSARLRGRRCPGEAPLSPRPGLDRCAQVTGRSALGARRQRPGIRRIAGRFVFADTCFGSCVDPRALTAFIVSPNRKNSDAYLRKGRVTEDTRK